MINRIIDFSVENKFIVFALVAVACIAGWWSMKHMTLDAIPDLSDTQVIIFSRWDRSPDIVEDQVTYPIVSAMVGAPKVKAVRGFSDFGYSYVYVIFEDGTDIYWARSRTQEYLSAVLPRLPEGARTEIGPDATPLGLDLPVRPGGRVREAQPGGSALLPGLLPEVLPEGRARRGRGGARGRVRPAVPGERGPQPAAGLRHLHQPGGGGGAGRQLRVGGPSDRVRGHGVQRAGPRLCPERGGHREHRGVGERLGHAHPHQGHRPGGAGPGHPPGASPTWTARGTWSRASSSCATGRTPWT